MQVDRRAVLAMAAIGVTSDAVAGSAADSVSVTNPRTEYLQNPLGIDTTAPRFSWRLHSLQRGVHQLAYRILVSSSESGLRDGVGNLWDSGRVEGDDTLEVAYEGVALLPRQRCFWRVEVWSNLGHVAAPIAWFELGLCAPEQWRAGWIAAEDVLMRGDREAGFEWVWGVQPNASESRGFRFGFDVDQAASEAKLFLAGKSKIEALWLDGAAIPLPDGEIINSIMSVIDVGALPPGHHVIALRATHQNSLIPGQGVGALLRMHLADGTVRRLSSGSSWKTAFATDDDFSAIGFDDNGWANVIQPRIAPARIPWRTPAVQLRRTFFLSGPIARARLYATALGAYEAHINGSRIGDAHMSPDYTDPSKRVLYQIYDVTRQLRQGDNAIGFWVGDGWYASQFSIDGRYAFGPAPRRMRGQLEIEYASGERQLVTTDGSEWRVSSSPVLYSDVYGGEIYDARLGASDWSLPEFNDSAWDTAIAADAPNVRVEVQSGPRIRPMLMRAPVSRTSPRPGVYVYDFGQNFAGWAKLKARGPAGTRIRLRFSEVLRDDGEIDQSNLRSARATDEFILAGERRAETFEPRFTFHGFRYVEVTGYPGTPPRDALEAVVAYTACETTAALSVDNETINGVWRNAVWSQRSNFFGMPTDCPQRDERLGWLGDAQVFWDAACYNMDVSAFTRKFMDDVRHAQNAQGAFPDVVPPFAPALPQGSPGWADAGVILPHTAFRHYGDTSIIDNNWSAMGRWIDYVLINNPDFIWRRRRASDYADWLAVNSRFPGDATTPKELVATAMRANSTKLMMEMANATGRTAEAARYSELWGNIQQAFAAAFLNPDGSVGNGSQTGHVLALHFGLLPEPARRQAADHLAADIRRRGDKLSTGFLGTPYILDALAEHGHSDVAYSLLLQTEYPSWGYMLHKGATTMWERWNSDVGDVGMNSYNHYAFGAVVSFMFRRVAGIEAGAPGFKTVVVRPLMDPRVETGGADYESIRGRIATRWRRRGNGGFVLDVTIPANTTGRVHIPARDGVAITEGERALEQQPNVRLVARDRTHAIVEIDAGSYSFRAR